MLVDDVLERETSRRKSPVDVWKVGDNGEEEEEEVKEERVEELVESAEDIPGESPIGHMPSNTMSDHGCEASMEGLTEVGVEKARGVVAVTVAVMGYMVYGYWDLASDPRSLVVGSNGSRMSNPTEKSSSMKVVSDGCVKSGCVFVGGGEAKRERVVNGEWR